MTRSGIPDILIITTPEELSRFQALLEDGCQWGLRISYVVQPRPEGLAQVFLLGKEFIGADKVCLILGDNIFYGHGFQQTLKRATQIKSGALIFGYWVRDQGSFLHEYSGCGRVVFQQQNIEDNRGTPQPIRILRSFRRALALEGGNVCQAPIRIVINCHCGEVGMRRSPSRTEV